MGWFDWLFGLLLPFKEPPAATLFILVIALIVNVVGGFVQKYYIRVGEVTRWTRELARWQKMLKSARSKGDKRQIEKASSMILALNTKILKRTMVRSFVLLGAPFLLVYWMLNFFYGHSLVAMLPFSFISIPGFLENIEGATYFTWIGWYFFTATSLGIITYKLFGIQPMGAE